MRDVRIVVVLEKMMELMLFLAPANRLVLRLNLFFNFLHAMKGYFNFLVLIWY